MFLETLKLHNFRCFEDLSVEFQNRLTVIVGGNGAGKTSILEGAAIAAGTLFVPLDRLAGRSIAKSDVHLKAFALGSTDDVQQQYPVDVCASGVVDGKRIQWTRSLNKEDGNTTVREAKALTSIANEYQLRLRSGDSTLILPIIAYYGTGRLWDYHREKKTDTFKKSTRTNGYVDSLDGTANIKLMMNWFRKMTIQKYQRQEENLGNIPELDTVYKAMESYYQSVTGYQDVKFQYNLNTNEIDVYYTLETGERMRIPLNELSDGYKSTISLIADIAYRMALLNPQLLDRVVSETDGIVFIDEIDLHLHPAWQQRILEDLLNIFPKVQFVVSTHAPAVISSVKSESLVILNDGKIEGTGNQVYGDDVNSVLTKIMGVPERLPEVASRFKQFYDLLKTRDFDSAEQVLNEIDEIRGGHDKELASCRVKLKLERIRGGQS